MTDDPDRSSPDQANLDKHLRNVASRKQAAQRRLNGDNPKRSRHVTLDQLPLFADERSLSDAVLGPGKYTHWRAVVSLLEGRGFPKIDGLMGGRYTRAVKAFFDREYRLDAAHLVASRDGPEALGTWKKKTRKTTRRG